MMLQALAISSPLELSMVLVPAMGLAPAWRLQHPVLARGLASVVAALEVLALGAGLVGPWEASELLARSWVAPALLVGLLCRWPHRPRLSILQPEGLKCCVVHRAVLPFLPDPAALVASLEADLRPRRGRGEKRRSLGEGGACHLA